MSKRIEQSGRHGHWDPRYAPRPAALQEGRVSLVTLDAGAMIVRVLRSSDGGRVYASEVAAKDGS